MLSSVNNPKFLNAEVLTGKKTYTGNLYVYNSLSIPMYKLSQKRNGDYIEGKLKINDETIVGGIQLVVSYSVGWPSNYIIYPKHMSESQIIFEIHNVTTNTQVSLSEHIDGFSVVSILNDTQFNDADVSVSTPEITGEGQNILSLNENDEFELVGTSQVYTLDLTSALTGDCISYVKESNSWIVDSKLRLLPELGNPNNNDIIKYDGTTWVLAPQISNSSGTGYDILHNNSIRKIDVDNSSGIVASMNGNSIVIGSSGLVLDSDFLPVKQQVDELPSLSSSISPSDFLLYQGSSWEKREYLEELSQASSGVSLISDKKLRKLALENSSGLTLQVNDAGDLEIGTVTSSDLLSKLTSLPNLSQAGNLSANQIIIYNGSIWSYANFSDAVQSVVSNVGESLVSDSNQIRRFSTASELNVQNVADEYLQVSLNVPQQSGKILKTRFNDSNQAYEWEYEDVVQSASGTGTTLVTDGLSIKRLKVSSTFNISDSADAVEVSLKDANDFQTLRYTQNNGWEFNYAVNSTNGSGTTLVTDGHDIKTITTSPHFVLSDSSDHINLALTPGTPGQVLKYTTDWEATHNIESMGGTSLVNDSSGKIKGIDAGSNITVNDTATSLEIAFSGNLSASRISSGVVTDDQFNILQHIVNGKIQNSQIESADTWNNKQNVIQTGDLSIDHIANLESRLQALESTSAPASVPTLESAFIFDSIFNKSIDLGKPQFPFGIGYLKEHALFDPTGKELDRPHYWSSIGNFSTIVSQQNIRNIVLPNYAGSGSRPSGYGGSLSVTVNNQSVNFNQNLSLAVTFMFPHPVYNGYTWCKLTNSLYPGKYITISLDHGGDLTELSNLQTYTDINGVNFPVVESGTFSNSKCVITTNAGGSSSDTATGAEIKTFQMDSPSYPYCVSAVLDYNANDREGKLVKFQAYGSSGAKWSNPSTSSSSIDSFIDLDFLLCVFENKNNSTKIEHASRINVANWSSAGMVGASLVFFNQT